MDTLDTLRRRIDSAQDLRSVVKTMKALAAVGIQHFREALVALADFRRAIEMGLQIALRNRPQGVSLFEPPTSNRLGAIVIGSDQGMCGQFNEDLAEHVIRALHDSGAQPQDRVALAVGLRVIGPLEESGQPVDEAFSIPTSLAGITPMVQTIVMKMEQLHLEQGLDRFILFYNKPISSGSSRPHTLQVLPVDSRWLQELESKPWPGRTLPTFTLEWRRLLASLVSQYLLVSVYRAVVESLMSENASRMASMQAAEENIEERLQELNANFHHQRQSSITAELLDIVGGFEALSSQEA